MFMRLIAAFMRVALQTQNDERDDDERDDEERDEHDERGEARDEQVRVRAQEPRNQETKRDPKSSKAPRAEKPQGTCRSLRYTNELIETSKASETTHETSGCACELQDPQARETKSARVDQEPTSRTKNTQVPLTARVLTSFRQVPGVADLGARRREGDAGEEADLGARRGEGDTG